MEKRSLPVLVALFFFVAGVLVLADQYARIGIWFQVKDIHHETLALTSFALAVGVLVGSKLTRK